MEQVNNFQEPPPLPFSIQRKKKAIVIAWSILIFLNFVVPNILWFSLNFGTDVKEVIVYAIPAAIFGAVTIPNLIKRLYRLLQRGDNYRPLNAGRWEIDYFMMNFLVDFIAITLMISLGIAFGSFKLVCLPFPYLLTAIAPQLLITLILERFSNLTYPAKISSMMKGQRLRNGVYTIVEDVCAVDAGAGKEYRQAFDERWKASSEFRGILGKAAVIWGLGGTIVGVACIIVISVVDDKVVDWCMGWIVPPISASVMSFVTIYLSKSALRRERENWRQNGSERL